MGFSVPNTLAPLYQNFNMRFANAIRDAQPMKFADQISMKSVSTSREEHYPIFDRMPGKFREWIGERQKQGGSIFDYALRNKTWETTITLKREDIEDSQLNMQLLATDSAGYQVATWPEQLITSVIETSTTLATYDGQPFFSAAHPLGDGSSTVQSNLYSSATTGSRPFNIANLQAGLGAARSFKGSDGAPLGFGGQLTVMVPSALEWAARTALNASIVAPAVAAGGNSSGVAQSNVLTGAANLVINRWLQSQTAWYIFDASTPLKPFIFQERGAPAFVWLNRPTDSNVFWHNEVIYGADARGNAGLGLWFMALKFDV